LWNRLSIYGNTRNGLERASDYFSSRWNIDKKLYLDRMNDSVSTDESVPRWYLMLRGDNIIGGFGLIDNDFMVRTDLRPWLCALYIEPAERGLQRGARLRLMISAFSSHSSKKVTSMTQNIGGA